jgi:hypothetical protein
VRNSLRYASKKYWQVLAAILVDDDGGQQPEQVRSVADVTCGGPSRMPPEVPEGICEVSTPMSRFPLVTNWKSSPLRVLLGSGLPPGNKRLPLSRLSPFSGDR